MDSIIGVSIHAPILGYAIEKETVFWIYPKSANRYKRSFFSDCKSAITFVSISPHQRDNDYILTLDPVQLFGFDINEMDRCKKSTGNFSD